MPRLVTGRTEGTILNPKLKERFAYVVAGIRGYKNEVDTNLIDLLSRLRVEARLTDTNWNLFGYEDSTTAEYFETHLGRGDTDIVFVPQNSTSDKLPTDQEVWRKASAIKAVRQLFPDNPGGASKDDYHESTWCLARSEEKRNHGIKEVPRFFQISGERGRVFRGLVFKDIAPYNYGEVWLDGSLCRHMNETHFKRQRGHSPLILKKLKEPHSAQELIPVIATATLFHPFAVNLVHPEDHKLGK